MDNLMHNPDLVYFNEHADFHDSSCEICTDGNIKFIFYKYQMEIEDSNEHVLTINNDSSISYKDYNIRFKIWYDKFERTSISMCVIFRNTMGIDYITCGIYSYSVFNVISQKMLKKIGIIHEESDVFSNTSGYFSVDILKKYNLYMFLNNHIYKLNKNSSNLLYYLASDFEGYAWFSNDKIGDYNMLYCKEPYVDYGIPLECYKDFIEFIKDSLKFYVLDNNVNSYIEKIGKSLQSNKIKFKSIEDNDLLKTWDILK